jgi:hypothetical protein
MGFKTYSTPSAAVTSFFFVPFSSNNTDHFTASDKNCCSNVPRDEFPSDTEKWERSGSLWEGLCCDNEKREPSLRTNV